MINEIKAHVKEKLQSAGYKKGKIITNEDSGFDAEEDVRPPAAWFGLIIKNLEQLDHLGQRKKVTFRALMMLSDKSQNETFLKIIEIDKELTGTWVEFEDTRFVMDDVFMPATVPEPVSILKNEATYALEFECSVVITHE